MKFKDKVVFLTGGSRGIGKAIALRLAQDGESGHCCKRQPRHTRNCQGTVYSAAEEIEAAGGKALPLIVDIRDEAQVEAAVNAAVDEFGGIDICINNASAIFWRGPYLHR